MRIARIYDVKTKSSALKRVPWPVAAAVRKGADLFNRLYR